MNIHILPSIGQSLLRLYVTEHIVDSGHQVTEGIACAHYVVGLLNSPEWHKVQDTRIRIVLKDPSEVLTGDFGEAVFVSPFTLTLNGTGKHITLCEWLKNAPNHFE